MADNHYSQYIKVYSTASYIVFLHETASSIPTGDSQQTHEL